MKDKIADNIEYYDESWLEKVIAQEKLLTVDSFTRKDAMNLGLKCIQLGKEAYQSDVAVQIFMDGCTVFSCFMGTTGLKNEWWISVKHNTIVKTGVSSLRAHLERVMGKIPFEDWCFDDMNYILCGGGFPIKNKEGDILAIAIVSAMKHEENHQLVVDALADMLNVDVVSIM